MLNGFNAMNGKSISVIVPCFNEGKTILNNLKKISEFLEYNFDNFEIIAVNDGSYDDTLSELKEASKLLELKIVNNLNNCGKGAAVKNGMLASSNEIVMFMDADLAIPIEELPKFIDTIGNGTDIAIASRFVPGLNIKKKVLWYRKIMEHIFRLLRIMITNNKNIRDTQCGFKVFTREASLKIFPKMTIERFAFDSEIIFIANKMGFSIKELPITLQNPTESHVRLFRDPLNMIIDLLKIRMNSVTGKYADKK